MLFYYRWFHAKGPILWKNIDSDIELNNKVQRNPQVNPGDKSTGLTHVRSFKSLQKDKSITHSSRYIFDFSFKY